MPSLAWMTLYPSSRMAVTTLPSKSISAMVARPKGWRRSAQGPPEQRLPRLTFDGLIRFILTDNTFPTCNPLTHIGHEVVTIPGLVQRKALRSNGRRAGIKLLNRVWDSRSCKLVAGEFHDQWDVDLLFVECRPVPPAAVLVKLLAVVGRERDPRLVVDPSFIHWKKSAMRLSMWMISWALPL